jgi:nitrate/nitrite-specific signal transduction histidine kinase
VQTDTFIHQVDLANCNKDGQCNQDCPLGRTGWQLISAPLKSKSRILGAVTLITHPPARFPTETAQLLDCIGHQLGVGVENAYFHEQAGQLAILEERGRLARELHDNLAQTIGYLNLNTRIITDMVKVGQYNEAQTALDDMRQSTRNAYDDLRWAIFDLRAPIEGDQDFQAALQEYLDEFEVQTGLKCDLVATSGNHLSPNIKVQLFRIAQEAMHNVRKHARAQRIWVSFEQNGDDIRLSIEDDGIGIDHNHIDPSTHQFGLRSMRERAASIGWQLQIGLRPAGGTRIMVQHSN